MASVFDFMHAHFREEIALETLAQRAPCRWARFTAVSSATRIARRATTWRGCASAAPANS